MDPFADIIDNWVEPTQALASLKQEILIQKDRLDQETIYVFLITRYWKMSDPYHWSYGVMQEAIDFVSGNESLGHCNNPNKKDSSPFSIIIETPELTQKIEEIKRLYLP